MSGGSDDRNDTGASVADGGSAPPSDSGAGGQAGGQPAGQAAGQAHAGGAGGMDVERYAKVGGAIYGAFGLGTAVTFFLYITMADGGGIGTSSFFGGMTGGGELLVAVASAFGFVVILGPVVAVGVGVLATRLAEAGESPPLVGAATTGIGALATMLVLLILVVIFAPEGASIKVGDAIAPIIGAVIGLAVTSAGAAYGADELDIL